MKIFACFIARLTSVSRTRLNIYQLRSINVIKEMSNVQFAAIELWMHLGSLLSTQEARVALTSLPSASIFRQLHAARVPFLKYRNVKS